MIWESELAFEDKLIKHLVSLGGTKQWEYLPGIKTTPQLWNNFKAILEQHNQDKLDHELSSTEFSQVRNKINQLKTPYDAGSFLYGFNGISQIEVDLDDGRHVYLNVFDQDQIGAGNTVYQIVNQIERPAVIAGRKDRRFDVTLLINGLPIIQIEEKADGHDVKEALNQMHQYIQEEQFSGIYATIQILVAMTPHDVRYMARTTADKFNTDFAFEWQREKDNRRVLDSFEFANSMLSIPMAHQMATNYMILDGTPHHQMIKIMRPYQVYATRKVISKLRGHLFGVDDQKIGYIWHTTGSGKTISSFKAAWLASRLPNVNKVVFMVDRVALTNQTVDEYRAYDPENRLGKTSGVVMDTANRWQLERLLKSKGKGIIVTSTQKMDAMVRNKDFKPIDKSLVFIVDEAHRSTAGEMVQRIKDAFPKSAWIGYTGTPVFADKDGKSNGSTTQSLFGDVLHIYTIQDAIKDGNVLGFKVDFETTLANDVLRNEYLPQYFKARYPKMTDEEVVERIKNLNDDDMDDMVEPSVYDGNQKHVEKVVEDILKNWNKRSVNGQYNAILTTHVGGGKASTPMAMMYYREFKRQNKLRANPLRVGITFSQATNNSDNQLDTNQALQEAINDYNHQFGTNFDDKTTKEYTEQVVARLNRTIDDGRYFDLVIVVDQLLTGFNAPQLNTLYVDRTLKDATLIQAYSRTNRVYDMQTKPFGRIVNYRWPSHTEKLMNEALSKYANRASADYQAEIIDIVAPPYDKVVEDLKKVVDNLRNFSNEFVDIPASESQQVQMYKELHQYNHLMALAKQDDQYDEEHPEKLLNKVGMTLDNEETLTTTLANRLTEKIARQKSNNGIDITNLDLRMEHVKEVKVNWDYLEELIAQVVNKMHEQDVDGAQADAKQVQQLADQLEDRKIADKIERFMRRVLAGSFKHTDYPVAQNEVQSLISKDNQDQRRQAIFEYKKKWGLADISSSRIINELIDQHVADADDLNVNGSLDQILREAQVVYQTDAEDETVRKLNRIKYRVKLSRDLTAFANEIKKNYE